MKLSHDLVHADIALDESGIATVTIRGAGELNILGTPAIADLRQAFEQLSIHEGVRVAVLRGSGDKAFVAGADLKEMCALTPETARTFIDGLRGLCESVRHCPVPVIARLAGFAWVPGWNWQRLAISDWRPTVPSSACRKSKWASHPSFMRRCCRG